MARLFLWALFSLGLTGMGSTFALLATLPLELASPWTPSTSPETKWLKRATGCYWAGRYDEIGGYVRTCHVQNYRDNGARCILDRAGNCRLRCAGLLGCLTDCRCRSDRGGTVRGFHKTKRSSRGRRCAASSKAILRGTVYTRGYTTVAGILQQDMFNDRMHLNYGDGRSQCFALGGEPSDVGAQVCFSAYVPDPLSDRGGNLQHEIVDTTIEDDPALHTASGAYYAIIASTNPLRAAQISVYARCNRKSGRPLRETIAAAKATGDWGNLPDLSWLPDDAPVTYHNITITDKDVQTALAGARKFRMEEEASENARLASDSPSDASPIGKMEVYEDLCGQRWDRNQNYPFTTLDVCD